MHRERIRSVKPELRRHRQISKLGVLPHLLAFELITFADDQGRFPASLEEVREEVLPYHKEVSDRQVERALQALVDVGYVELYEVRGQRYGWIRTWFEHQRLQTDRLEWSEYPTPDGFHPCVMTDSQVREWKKAKAEGKLPRTGDGAVSDAGWNQRKAFVESHVSTLESDVSESRAVRNPRAPGRARADRSGAEHEEDLNTPVGPSLAKSVDNSPSVRGGEETWSEADLEDRIRVLVAWWCALTDLTPTEFMPTQAGVLAALPAPTEVITSAMERTYAESTSKPKKMTAPSLMAAAQEANGEWLKQQGRGRPENRSGQPVHAGGLLREVIG
jgi:hypothetical protein